MAFNMSLFLTFAIIALLMKSLYGAIIFSFSMAALIYNFLSRDVNE